MRLAYTRRYRVRTFQKGKFERLEWRTHGWLERETQEWLPELYELSSRLTVRLYVVSTAISSVSGNVKTGLHRHCPPSP
jgi:hypothetical protein